VGRALGGSGLALALVWGGMVSAAGAFNALVLSYSRVPATLADSGLLPAVFGQRTQTGVPWVAVVVCGAAYIACLGLGFGRLVELDVVVYGLSLVLELLALVVLRLKEPRLPRPFRIPGGWTGVWAVVLAPSVLMAGIGISALRTGARHGLVLSLIVTLVGFPLYWTLTWRRAMVSPPLTNAPGGQDG
jgi:amino acid transporter